MKEREKISLESSCSTVQRLARNSVVGKRTTA